MKIVNTRPSFFSKSYWEMLCFPIIAVVMLSLCLSLFLSPPLPWTICGLGILGVTALFTAGHAMMYLDCYSKQGEFRFTDLSGEEHNYALYGYHQGPRHRLRSSEEWKRIKKGDTVTGGEVTVVDYDPYEDFCYETERFNPVRIKEARYL